MGLFGFIGKVALGVAAVAAAPIVLPAAATAAAAAGAAAAGAAATAATAVGGAVAATGAAAAGAAATVGSAVAAAGSTAAGVAAAAGTKVAVAAGAAKAATAAAITAKTAAGVGVIAAGGTGVYKYTEMKADEAEERGRRQGFGQGFREGKIKAAEEFQKMLAENENLLFGTFAMALYVARLDGEAKEETAYIEECLGHEQLRSEEIRHEIQNIYKNTYNFYEIRARYLDKASLKEIMVVDEVIKGVMDADGTVSEKEKQFYVTTWQPYVKRLNMA